MRRLILFLFIISLFSFAVVADCCKVVGDCYDADLTACNAMSGDHDAADCDIADACERVYECYPGEIDSCTDHGESASVDGEKTCNLNKVFGPCIIIDSAYLASIDSDDDGDPDDTDCEPDNIQMSWGSGCDEHYSPASSRLSALLKIIIFAMVIYIIFKLVGKYKETNGKKKVSKKKKKK